MNGSFLNLNSEEVEKNVMSWYKGLFKVSRVFTQKEATVLAADCEEIRKQVSFTGNERHLSFSKITCKLTQFECY